MLKKELKEVDISEEDVYKLLEKQVSNSETIEGISINSVEIERLYDSKDNLTSEEVTIWLNIDEDMYDTFRNPVSNEITVKVPKEIEWGLIDLVLELNKEIEGLQSNLTKYK